MDSTYAGGFLQQRGGGEVNPDHAGDADAADDGDHHHRLGA